MSFKFGKKSLELLNKPGLDKRLVDLCNKVIEISPIDFSIVETIRTKEKQEELFKSGKSKTMKSKHLDGKAIDIVGVYEKYEKALDITFLSGLFYGVASMMGIKIRVGALWDKDSMLKNNFLDIYHIEIKD